MKSAAVKLSLGIISESKSHTGPAWLQTGISPPAVVMDMLYRHEYFLKACALGLKSFTDCSTAQFLLLL